MRNDVGADAEVGERLAAALAVDDHAVEAREDAPPQVLAGGGSPRQEVVGGEDGRRPEPEMDVRLWQGQPLQMQNVGTRQGERPHHVDVLDPLQRQPKPRTSEQPRGERVEPLAASIPVGGWNLAEPEPGRRELDGRAGSGERRRQLVVVPRRECRRIREQYAHRSSVDLCSSGPGTSFTATRSHRNATRSSTRW